MKSISLFTGAGGLDLGLEAAGFEPALCVEIDKDSRLTLRVNRPHWKLLEPGDIHAYRPEAILEQTRLKRKEAALLSGGPPCQPFSKASFWVNGKARGLPDKRANTLKAYIKVAEVALPQFLILENVQVNYTSGKNLAMEFLKSGMEWINRRNGTKYRWNFLYLNAADYGVPQTRVRAYLVADRDGRPLQSPPATHDSIGYNDGFVPYMTAWDAIGDLDKIKWNRELTPRGKWAQLLPSIPEGWNYLWHTDRGGGKPIFGYRTRFWSFLLKLAKNKRSWTISASPGPATGPFHWRNRLLSVRELCRLQTFLDNYEIRGVYSSARRQVGNAVPPLIAEVIGREICRQWLNVELKKPLKYYTFSCRIEKPGRYPYRHVPPEYHHLVGRHPSHPGIGKGPRALTRSSQ